jgi:predicted Fe-Mo cluster-binding NifX family protein
MKVAIFADGSDLNAKIAYRLGVSKYLLIIDIDSGEFEAVPNPADAGRHGAGVQAIELAVKRGVKVILTKYCSPSIVHQFKATDIEILTGVTGTVKDAVEHYKKGRLERMNAREAQHGTIAGIADKDMIIRAAESAARQFATLLPVLICTVLLIGLFKTFVSKKLLSSIFSGNVVLDTLWGAFFGSIFAGNPINSYIIGGELLEYGVSLFAVTAFLITWVTVGLVQMPAEIAALGKRFALFRNGLSFVFSIMVAILTVTILNFLERWIS